MKTLIIKVITRLRWKLQYGKYESRIHSGEELDKRVAKNQRVNIIYRISDAGYKKRKPDYINNENCLANAVKNFPLTQHNWVIIADNCCDATLTIIEKYIPKENIKIVSIGHGAGTFNLALDIALGLGKNEVVYFLENDYIHRSNASKVLGEGFCLDDDGYFTLYDHPDKYYIRERSIMHFTKSTHWRESNSTTMTFATKVKTLKCDEKVLRKWTKGKHPLDWQMFLELKYFNKRKLYSSVPGYSTHGETIWLSPVIDWDIVSSEFE
ncbi:glycosyltransferase family 2 protein [Maribellus maritimus]|uniref:glycosyltransferase family 2 protein n=1 Tax=Maribellus maritimus TaxID=2870838 RepID=UPI001EEAE58A|nr:glycosyltransferase family 2 protein [Maribellus maritimus]MCG6188444.1 glycosyltransferase family 2 protein [Maribellus maritimus]